MRRQHWFIKKVQLRSSEAHEARQRDAEACPDNERPMPGSLASMGRRPPLCVCSEHYAHTATAARRPEPDRAQQVKLACVKTDTQEECEAAANTGIVDLQAKCAKTLAIKMENNAQQQ